MNTPNWSANPIFIDFETQSACNIKEDGGRAYVEHPSTRILILVCVIDNVFHVWIPDYIRVNTSSWDVKQLWPYQLNPRQEVRFYRGTNPDTMLSCIPNDRPLCAHNAYGFDKGIWNRFLPNRFEWLDTLPLARQSGRNGRLDSLGKNILGVGKDHAKKLLPLLTTATESLFFQGGYSYPVIKSGDLQAFTRYAVGDVELLRRLWIEFDRIKVEADVIEHNNIINERGIEVDLPLLDTIEKVSEYSVSQAAQTIKELTVGRLHENNLRSGKQVQEWLESYGVVLVDDKGKKCLRKEIVDKFIKSPYIVDDNLHAVKEIPPLVIDVLRLRMKALRITGAKVSRAKNRVSKDGRIRDLITYHKAHTGRYSSSGVQIHNLPRPHEDVSGLLESYISDIDTSEKDVKKVFDRIKEKIPAPKGNKTPATVDDVSSGLLRLSFKSKKGYKFAIADYSQVEARCLALVAGENKMLEAFKAGRDLYREFAATMFHCLPPEVSDDQRQIAKNVVLGCGYSLGPTKFRVYAANAGADLVKAGITAEECIEIYRDTYTKIAGWRPDKGANFRVGGLWKDLDKGVKECVGSGASQYIGKCGWRMDGSDLICTLPSSRELWYPNARIEDVIPPYVYTLNLPQVPKATVVYEGDHGTKSLYGGLITENVIQAICRDLLATALLRLEELGFCPVAHIHDEIICEVPEDSVNSCLDTMIRVMSNVPNWVEGFPLEVEGFTSPRFTKKRFKDEYHTSTRRLLA